MTNHEAHELSTTMIERELELADGRVRLPRAVAACLADIVDAVDLVHLDVALDRVNDASANVEVLVFTTHLIVRAHWQGTPLDGSAQVPAPTTTVWPLTQVTRVSIRGAETTGATAQAGAHMSGLPVRSVSAHLGDGTVVDFPLTEHNRFTAGSALRMLLGAP